MTTTRRAAAIGVLLVLWGHEVPAQRRTHAIGVDGPGWRELASRWIALDDTSAPGFIQPKELKPWENIMVGPEEATNLFGFQWHTNKGGLDVLGRELGVNPRVWAGAFPDPALLFLDGDGTTALQVLKVVPQVEFDTHSNLTENAYSAGFRQDWLEAWTFDLGIAVPVERIRFYPPQRGLDADGVPNARRAPQGFELSVARHPQDFLLLGNEPVSQTTPWGPLEQVILRTLFNSQSIVDLRFELQPIRFLRLNVGLLRQFYSLAELEVYGRGVPPRVEYLSRPIDLGVPVDFGGIAFDFVPLRRHAEGELAEDPTAPVQLVLQTRTGRDDSPLAYFVIDDLGRDVEVTEAEYREAELPKQCCQNVRLPGTRSAVTDDREQWTPWSSPYTRSGEQNRSADGRQWLQFRFEILTQDVLAIGRLRSLRFEYSPLLARTVVGEISLLEQPELEVVEVPAGEGRRYVIDLRAEFDSAAQTGFDGVRLDVPPDTRFVSLEMADRSGGSFGAVAVDSLREERTQLELLFPASRVDGRDNRAVRIVLDATVRNAATVFTGEVLDTGSQNLPQSIDAGNARDEVAADALQVFASQRLLPVLAGVGIEPAVVTPNGDGVNDAASIGFQLMGVERAEVSIAVVDLMGRRVAQVADAVLGLGRYAFPWAGTDATGQPVPPGLYLCRLAVTTDRGQHERLVLLPVAY